MKIVALLLAVLGLLFLSGNWQAEGTMRGPIIVGAMRLSVRGRTVRMVSRNFRPGRCYYFLSTTGG